MVMMLLQTTSRKKRTSLMKMISKLTPPPKLKDLMIFFWVCWQVTESDLTKPSPPKQNKALVIN